MKKVIPILACFFITASLAHANIPSLGPRVGTSIFQIKATSAQGSKELASLQLEKPWGYHVGLFTRLDLSLFYVQPEVLFTSYGAKFKKKNNMYKLGFTKLDIPVLVGLSLFRIFRAQIGPVFSWLLSAKEGEKNVKKCYSNSTIGWQAGLGVDIRKMSIDFKYEGSLSRFGDKIADISTHHGHALWILSVGFNML